MSISYANDEVPIIYKKTPRSLSFLILVNAVIACATLFAWKVVGLFVSDPVTWATWVPVYRGNGFDDIIRYPFVILWLWPAIGIIGAWASIKMAKHSLAFAFASMPVVVLGLVFGWYYLAPQTWQ